MCLQLFEFWIIWKYLLYNYFIYFQLKYNQRLISLVPRIWLNFASQKWDMKKFKEKWEIQQNWQLIFPFFGLIGLIYSGYKISKQTMRCWFYDFYWIANHHYKNIFIWWSICGWNNWCFSILIEFSITLI